jgi:hypothetical protein
LEVLPLKKKHVENLETFHRKSIHYLQSLPQRIATAAIYLLVGAVPIEAELHPNAEFRKKFRALRDKKINILTLVLSEKKILNETKNHNIKNQLEKTCKKRGWKILVEKTSE